MITIRNLAKVEPGVGSLVVLAELAGVGIPALDVAAPRGRISVRGLLQFTDGQAATFTRQDESYLAQLDQAIAGELVDKFKSRRGHDSEIMAKELVLATGAVGYLSFELKSRLALEDFVELLIEIHYRPLYNAYVGPSASVARYLPEAREFVPAPRGDRETARIEIRALLALSRAYEPEPASLDVMEDALWAAITHFGDRSRKVMDIRASLVKAYDRAIKDLQRKSAEGIAREPNTGRDTIVESIEHCLVLHIRNLRALKRHKQARSEEAKLEAMREPVSNVLVEELDKLMVQLRHCLSNKASGFEALEIFWGTIVDSIAFTALRLAEVYRAMGRLDDAAQLEKEGWLPARKLVPVHLDGSMRLPAKAASRPPGYYEAKLLEIREAQRASRRRRRVEAAQQQDA